MATDVQKGVKASVEYVCNLLTSLGAPPVTPETLRQAKFNAPAAAGKLWPVLHSLVLLQLTGFPQGDISDRLSELWANLDLEGQHEKIAAFVEYYLRLWGCSSQATPHAESFEKTQSRDLLIALGWLIAHTDVFSRGLQIRTARLRKSLPPDVPLPLPSYPGDTTDCPRSKNAARHAYAQVSAHVARVKEAGTGLEGGAKADALVNEALTLYGRLRSELGSLASFDACQAKRKQELIHTQLEIRAKTVEAAAAAGVNCPPAPPLYGLYELQLLRKRSVLEAHEKALSVDEAIHTAAAESARHEALFWQWMESVVDEREAGGADHHSKPTPRDEEFSRLPIEADLAALTSELDLRIEDSKRVHKQGGVLECGSDSGEEGGEEARRIEEIEEWLRERGWESYDALLERVLEDAEVSGAHDVSGASLPDDVRALLEGCTSHAADTCNRGSPVPPEARAAWPAHILIPPVTKDGRNVRGKAGTGDPGPTAPLETDRLMKLALSSARELARTRADNKRALGRMLAHLEEVEDVLVSGLVHQP
ncbi:hypothetical protein KFL_004240070 [Klebsormidium nitens]|uniref:Tubulin epsilon and delta complex protein 1 domain-containing protein n=1 Tax=Klebsormidium nitens TaxID=105231 RepID=A0A1Y1IBR2_KLENI|nr:hypothetical protein KFL_004240070 [Klebsormidium nitens]|eukprot:GAQ88395.1 hypothetical protein KFL_004240070 [Klebsormidium nitens]